MVQECFEASFLWDAKSDRNQPRGFNTPSQLLSLRLRGLAKGEEDLLLSSRSRQANVGDGTDREKWFKIKLHEIF